MKYNQQKSKDKSAKEPLKELICMVYREINEIVNAEGNVKCGSSKRPSI